MTDEGPSPLNAERQAVLRHIDCGSSSGEYPWLPTNVRKDKHDNKHDCN